MFQSKPGSTGRLLQLCAAYFLSYVVTGVLVKWFTGGLHEPRMSDMAYLVNNTAGGLVVAITLLSCHMFLESKTTALIDSLEIGALKFLNTITERSAGNVAAPPPAPATPTASPRGPVTARGAA